MKNTKQAADTEYETYGKYGKYTNYGDYPGHVEKTAMSKMERDMMHPSANEMAGKMAKVKEMMD
jgi:hypothetical protein